MGGGGRGRSEGLGRLGRKGGERRAVGGGARVWWIWCNLGWGWAVRSDVAGVPGRLHTRSIFGLDVRTRGVGKAGGLFEAHLRRPSWSKFCDWSVTGWPARAYDTNLRGPTVYVLIKQNSKVLYYKIGSGL